MLNYLYKYIKKDLFQVIYHVTFRCNARCKFCFNWKYLNKNTEKELKLEEINRFSKTLPDFPWLMFSGGEPFLKQDIDEIAYLFYKNNKIKHLTIPTNGYLVDVIPKKTQNILEKCKNISLTISYSLDALYRKQDNMRNIKNGFKLLLKSYNQLYKLKENYPNLAIKINTVISNKNYKDLDTLIEFVKKLKPDMHTIDFIRVAPTESKYLLPPKEKIDNIIKKIILIYKYYGGYKNLKKHYSFMDKLSKSIQVHYLEIFKKILEKNQQIIPCYAYKTNLVIYPNGEISFCEILPPKSNIKEFDYNFKNILGSKKIIELQKTIKDKECACYHPCNQYVNILFNPKEIGKALLKK